MPIEFSQNVRVQMFGVPVDTGRFSTILRDLIDQALRPAQAGRYVVVANVHLLQMACAKPAVMQAFTHAWRIVTDGMPLVWLAKNAQLEAERIVGVELMEAMCAALAPKLGSIYLLGGDPGVAETLGAMYEKKFPGLRVVGTECPPFRAATKEEEKAQLKRIHDAEPDLLLVALGAPKQELWMERNCQRLQVPLTMGVGAAFDFALGRLHRAPKWMQERGLEWLFRLIQEPRRLFTRYLVTNSWFLWKVLTNRKWVTRKH